MEADVATTADTTANGDNPKEEVALKHLYEQSTQYKYWRYTQAALDEIRRKANKEAIAVIGENIKEEREQAGHRLHSAIAQGKPVDHLPENPGFPTVDEEQALLGFYERKIVQIFKYWKLPSNVMATAIVYMKRFFLENTVMDYHPKAVMMTCMFLARKTENFLMTIGDFSTAIKSSPAAILNLEFLVCKSLRFQFTVHHPYRPCLGFFYDMQAVADNMEKLQKVYDKAVDLIDTLLYTDLCFLYQPSQIALAAMKIACRLESYDFEKYVNYKFKANETTAQMYNDKLLPVLLDIEKVMETDPRCKEVKKAVVAEIDKRLMLCEDPARKPGSAM
ncbi:MAG: cyclin-like protein [Benniella sp.]|nr:MAG: cyclin-like protein [Benniella sp.]